MIQGKYQLELNFVDDRLFLNYWDWKHGNDVVAEIHDGKLLVRDVDSRVVQEEITFNQFLDRVKVTLENQNDQ